MPALILPAAIDSSTLALVLTPGTYSQLVIDNLGEQDFEADPSLAAADNASILTDAMGNDPMGAGDTAVALGGVAAAVTQGNGAKNAADLAPVAKAVGVAVNNFLALVQPLITAANPPSPPVTPSPTPTAPDVVSVISAPGDGYLGAPNLNGPGPTLDYAAENTGQYEANYTVDGVPFSAIDADYVPGFTNDANVTAATLLQVQGAPVQITLTPLPDGVTSVVPAYCYCVFDFSVGQETAGIIAIQINNQPTWYNLTFDIVA